MLSFIAVRHIRNLDSCVCRFTNVGFSRTRGGSLLHARCTPDARPISGLAQDSDSSTASMARSGSAGVSPAPGASRAHDIHAAKSRLFNALGDTAAGYWATLRAFCAAKMDRQEFEDRVAQWLPAEHIPLHNALVLAMLAGALHASAQRRHTRGRHRAYAPSSLITARSGFLYDSDDSEDAYEPPLDQNARPGSKMLRHMYAGLSQKERQRLQHLPVGSQASLLASSAGWAGAGAELLEKKRKEDEKRKSVEERRRTREAKTAIGAPSWRTMAMHAASQAESLRPHLSSVTQGAFARGVTAPQCVEDHSLPDVHAMQDRMTLTAVEAGLTGGVQVQAAAVVLSALQDHLRNIICSTLTKVRSQERGGITMQQRAQTPPADAMDVDTGPTTAVPSARMSVPDLALLLDLSPQAIVEPLGQDTMTRMLAPDALDPNCRASSIDGGGMDWSYEDALAAIARQCSTKKVDGTALPHEGAELDEASGSSVDASGNDEQLRRRQQRRRDSMRGQVLIDQLAPLRLLDRRTLAETLAGSSTAAAQTASETTISKALEQHNVTAAQRTHHHQHANPNHRHKDEFYDVVDPIALLGQLCE